MDIAWAWARHSLVSPFVWQMNSRLSWTWTQRITARLVIFPMSSPCTHCGWDAPCTPNPKSTVMKHLCCQKGYVYPPFPQRHFPTPFPKASIDTTTWAANSSQTALQCMFCLLNPLNQHIMESDAQQCQCKGSSWSEQPCSGDRVKGRGATLSAAALRWCHVIIQQGLFESHIRTAASKGLLQTQLGARLKCLSDSRLVNSHVAAVAAGHKTLSPVPDFSSFMFAFGENSKGFLKDMFCHLCYRIW